MQAHARMRSNLRAQSAERGTLSAIASLHADSLALIVPVLLAALVGLGAHLKRAINDRREP
jgi:hypothetical protein